MDLIDLNPGKFDAIFIPGGFGAAKNLSTFATDGPNMKVDPRIEKIIKEAVATNTHIGLCCISPILISKVLGKAYGGPGSTITLGKKGSGFPYSDSIDIAISFGNTLKDKDVKEICVDEINNIVTTPAYMKEARPHEVYDGIQMMVKEVIDRIGKK